MRDEEIRRDAEELRWDEEPVASAMPLSLVDGDRDERVEDEVFWVCFEVGRLKAELLTNLPIMVRPRFRLDCLRCLASALASSCPIRIKSCRR